MASKTVTRSIINHFFSLLPQLICFLSLSLVVLMYINWAAYEATQFIRWVSSGLLVSFFCQRKRGGGVIFGKSWCGALSASWNFWLGQISPTIFWEAGIGEGCVKIMLTVSCLEWPTCLFLFIMVEFEKVLYDPDVKMVLIFLVTKVFQMDTMFK